MMKLDKLHKFHDAYVEYFKKKTELEKLSYDLKCLHNEVNEALNNTIDNGLDIDYLELVKFEYDRHKFESKTVQEFLDRIDRLLFLELDMHKKERLEVVSIAVNTRHMNSYDIYTCMQTNSQIAIDFIDIQSNRAFTVYIPVKTLAYTDIVNWQKNGNGLYVVVAAGKYRYKNICKVFDPSKVAIAVERLLDGAFDVDLSSINIDEFTHNIYVNEYNKFNYSCSVSNMFTNNDNYTYCDASNTCVNDCIDDTNEFAIKNI